MLQSKVKKIVELMHQSQIEDPDIVEDVDYINKKLETLVMDVSTFDEYTLEITSNRLSWSPAHKSDKFWRENAQRLNENNFYLVRLVVASSSFLSFAG
jgi:V-type H+-transporting ATPase subunit H